MVQSILKGKDSRLLPKGSLQTQKRNIKNAFTNYLNRTPYEEKKLVIQYSIVRDLALNIDI
jgi:hypothetical protein